MSDTRKKVLIVDDEREFLLILGKMVRDKGYTVLAADNGRDALEIAREQLPDIIIMDVMMPGMNGREVGRLLREREETRDIPVIYLTGLISQEDTEQADHNVQGQVVFSKPCKMDDLLSAMEKLVREKGR